MGVDGGRGLGQPFLLLALLDNPSSKQSKNLAEELGKAVKMMGKGKTGIGFGKVDITVEKELKQEFDIKKAPELKLFFEGNRSEPISCKGNDALCHITFHAYVKPACQPEALTHMGSQGLRLFPAIAVPSLVAWKPLLTPLCLASIWSQKSGV